MSSFEFIELLQTVEGQSFFSGEKSELLVLKAESYLGVAFSRSYREFLKSFGCGDINGLEIYGIVDDDFVNSGVPDAIWCTQNERNTNGLPQHYVVIGSTGDGGLYCLDTSVLSGQDECPVVLIEHNDFNQVMAIAHSFNDYIVDSLNQ